MENPLSKDNDMNWSNRFMHNAISSVTIGKNFFFMSCTLFGILAGVRYFYSLANIATHDGAFLKLIDYIVLFLLFLILVIIIINLPLVQAIFQKAKNVFAYKNILKNSTMLINIVTPGLTKELYQFELTEKIINIETLDLRVKKIAGDYWRAGIRIGGIGYEKLNFHIYEGDSTPTRENISRKGLLQYRIYFNNSVSGATLDSIQVDEPVFLILKFNHLSAYTKITCYINGMKCAEVDIALNPEDKITITSWSDNHWERDIMLGPVTITG